MDANEFGVDDRFSLLSFLAAVIVADHKVEESELDFIHHRLHHYLSDLDIQFLEESLTKASDPQFFEHIPIPKSEAIARKILWLGIELGCINRPLDGDVRKLIEAWTHKCEIHFDVQKTFERIIEIRQKMITMGNQLVKEKIAPVIANERSKRIMDAID